MSLNYAHRGASGYYPENTMLAFEKAVEMGCQGIETDVQLTRDGVLILCHDEMVDRTTDGTGAISEYTYDEIRKLDAAARWKGKFKDVKIPSLEEFLSFVSSNNIVINIEIKNGIVEYDGIEKKVIDMVNRYGMHDRTILSSFNHYSMVKCKELDSSIKTGLLDDSWIYRPEAYLKYAGADAFHPMYRQLSKGVVDGIKKEGFMINTYTVNTERDMRKMIDLKIDGIITNYPDRLKKLLEE